MTYHFADVVKMVEIGSNAVRDVDDAGFGRIRSKGDQALFGGRSTQEKRIAMESGVLPNH